MSKALDSIVGYGTMVQTGRRSPVPDPIRCKNCSNRPNPNPGRWPQNAEVLKHSFIRSTRRSVRKYSVTQGISDRSAGKVCTGSTPLSVRNGGTTRVGCPGHGEQQCKVLEVTPTVDEGHFHISGYEEHSAP
jgi:hypothetical protein